MTLTKTTTNYAAKRGYEIHNESDEDQIWFCAWIDSDCDESHDEPDLVYNINEDGTFTFNSAPYLTQDIKEELPATIWNEKHLREVLNFISNN